MPLNLYSCECSSVEIAGSHRKGHSDVYYVQGWSKYPLPTLHKRQHYAERTLVCDSRELALPPCRWLVKIVFGRSRLQLGYICVQWVRRNKPCTSPSVFGIWDSGEGPAERSEGNWIKKEHHTKRNWNTQSKMSSNKDDGGWKKFVWDSDKGEFCGRTGGSWCKYAILIFKITLIGHYGRRF